MYDHHICPFYEEHGGEYYQGCWEYYDLCYCSPELGLNPTCYTGCFLIRNDEEKMLEVCLNALNRKVEIGHFKKELVTSRDLTKEERMNIIADIKTFIGVFNRRYNPPSFFK